MNQQDAARLIAGARYAGLHVPAEDVETMTMVWAGILTDVTYEDAATAVVTLAQSAAFLTPQAIREQVKRVRADRLARCPLPAPNADPADAVAYATELRALRDAVAGGRFKPEHRAAYEAGGVSITGSHAALAVAAAPDPVEVEDGKRAAARLGITPKETP